MNKTISSYSSLLKKFISIFEKLGYKRTSEILDKIIPDTLGVQIAIEQEIIRLVCERLNISFKRIQKSHIKSENRSIAIFLLIVLLAENLDYTYAYLCLLLNKSKQNINFYKNSYNIEKNNKVKLIYNELQQKIDIFIKKVSNE